MKNPAQLRVLLALRSLRGRRDGHVTAATFAHRLEQELPCSVLINNTDTDTEHVDSLNFHQFTQLYHKAARTGS